MMGEVKSRGQGSRACKVTPPAAHHISQTFKWSIAEVEARDIKNLFHHTQQCDLERTLAEIRYAFPLPRFAVKNPGQHSIMQPCCTPGWSARFSAWHSTHDHGAIFLAILSMHGRVLFRGKRVKANGQRMSAHQILELNDNKVPVPYLKIMAAPWMT